MGIQNKIEKKKKRYDDKGGTYLTSCWFVYYYYCGIQEFKWAICATCHTQAWKGYCRTKEVTRLDSKATSVARY